jgi:hypothetical protein
VRDWALFPTVERNTPAPKTMIMVATTMATRREREVFNGNSFTSDCKQLLIQGKRDYLGNLFTLAYHSDDVVSLRKPFLLWN